VGRSGAKARVGASSPLDPGARFVYSYCTVSASPDRRLAVGLIGLGHMGAAFAERLVDAGYELVVYNRTPAKTAAIAARGATVAGSAAELAALVDVVLTSLADDEAFEVVAVEVVAAARPGTVLVDTSTVSPAASARVASLAGAASLAYLRAPVSGNPTVVRAGNLSFIVSGSRETLAHVEPVLRAIGPTVHYVGADEQARFVKLAINLMIAGLAQLMAEALVLGEAAGVSRASLLEVMGSSAVGAPFVRYKTDALLRDDFSATFTTALMEKDLDLVREAAEAVGVELPLADELKELVHGAVDAGYAHDDFMSLFPHLQSRSGVGGTSAPPSRLDDHAEQEVLR
jgi:3-hydroxyisobutyrate dehydrogenase-like beta-hydroxyacid dehydrogenase